MKCGDHRQYFPKMSDEKEKMNSDEAEPEYTGFVAMSGTSA